jgi:hypothetical protein
MKNWKKSIPLSPATNKGKVFSSFTSFQKKKPKNFFAHPPRIFFSNNRDFSIANNNRTKWESQGEINKII